MFSLVDWPRRGSRILTKPFIAKANIGEQAPPILTNDNIAASRYRNTFGVHVYNIVRHGTPAMTSDMIGGAAMSRGASGMTAPGH
jgi:hypothetical protein